jgi:5-methylcytosine-specific restriction endonuclease McrA
MKPVLEVLTLSSEDSLVAHCSELSDDQRKALIEALRTLLFLSPQQLEAQVLRILLERARPLLISQKTWSQPLSSSDPIRLSIQRHLEETLGLPVDELQEKSVAALEAIASNFKERRESVKVTDELLVAARYRCCACGFLFRDQDLEDLDIELPDEQKKVVAKAPRIDHLHPIARSDSYAKPRSDHVWPVSLYGSNREHNIRLLCDACNSGKANYMSYAHAGPNVGVFLPKFFSGKYVDPAVFYAVIARDGRCLKCEALPSEASLTLRKRRQEGVLVPDNLFAVCYRCADGA